MDKWTERNSVCVYAYSLIIRFRFLHLTGDKSYVRLYTLCSGTVCEWCDVTSIL